MLKRVTVLALGLILVACASEAPRLPRMAFPEAEYAALPKASGQSIIKGQAFLKTMGGDVKRAAGNPVVLEPVTSYSIEWFEKQHLQRLAMETPDPRRKPYIRTETADADGRFMFRNVPAGEYFVISFVRWMGQAPNGSPAPQGATVAKRVRVDGTESVDLILTR